MTHTQKVVVGTIAILLGTIWFIIASFNLKHDAAWLSVILISIISTASGVYIIDNLHERR